MSDFCYGDEMNTLCNNEFNYQDSMIINPPNKKESKLAQKYIFVDTADYNVVDGKFTVEFDETIKDIVEIELMSCHLPINDTTGECIDFEYNNTTTASGEEEAPAEEEALAEEEVPACDEVPADDLAISTNKLNYADNKYLLLFLDNLDLGNYKKISKNQNIKNCFARLPIQGKSIHTFFGRIKNFTNVYQFKPILQKLNKLTIRISNKDGLSLKALSDKLSDYTAALNTADEITRNENLTEVAKKKLYVQLNENLTEIAKKKFSVQLTFGITYQTTPDLFD